MNFFCTKKHLEDWVIASGADAGELFFLPAQEALIVARWLFSRGSG